MQVLYNFTVLFATINLQSVCLLPYFAQKVHTKHNARELCYYLQAVQCSSIHTKSDTILYYSNSFNSRFFASILGVWVYTKWNKWMNVLVWIQSRDWISYKLTARSTYTYCIIPQCCSKYYLTCVKVCNLSNIISWFHLRSFVCVVL